MSTGAAASPEMATKNKKRKNAKGHTDNNTKKRKREEAQRNADASAVPEVGETSSKKPKRKHEVEPTDTRPTVPPPSPEQATKISTKDKSKSKSKHPQPATSATTTTKKQQASEDILLQKHSPFLRQSSSLYLSLSPCAASFPLEGLCAEHLSPLLLTYYPPLQGIVLSYSNARMHSEDPTSSTHSQPNTTDSKAVLSQCIDEYGVTFVWLTADFLLFRPKRGTWVEGHVSLQNESLLGLVCYNYFNAVIEKDKLPGDWRWVGDDDGEEEWRSHKRKRKFGQGSGYFVDAQGAKVDGRVVFRVEDFEATSPGGDGGGGSVSIIGTLLPAHGRDRG